MLCFTPKFLPLPFTRVHYTVTSTNLQLKESHQYAAMLGRRRWRALLFAPLCPLQHASQAIVSITLFFLFVFFKAKAKWICLLFSPPIVFDSLGRRQLASHQPGCPVTERGDAGKIRDSEKYTAFKCKSGGKGSGDLFRLEVLQVSSGGGRAPFLLSKNKVSHAFIGEREHSASSHANSNTDLHPWRRSLTTRWSAWLQIRPPSIVSTIYQTF